MIWSQIVQTIAIIVSLVIALTGWFINWKQRINDNKPFILPTITKNFSDNNCVQIRNVGKSAALLQEFYIGEIINNDEKIISDGSKNLNYPMLPNQIVNSCRPIDVNNKYHIKLVFTEINKSREIKNEFVITGNLFRKIESKPLMNLQ